MTVERGWMPGLYELQVTPQFSGQSTTINLLATMIRFELRETVNVAHQAELTRRRLMRAFVNDDSAGIRFEANRLIELYPRSALAYEMLGGLAKREGRMGEAISSFQQSLGLITSGRDTLYLRYRTGAEVQRLVGDLTSTVNSLRAGR